MRGSLREGGVDVDASLFCSWTFTLTPLLLWANCVLLIRAVALAVNTGRPNEGPNGVKQRYGNGREKSGG